MTTPSSRFADVERQLASLAGSIRSREHVRGETLEQASHSSTRARSRRRAAEMIIMTSFILIMLSPLISHLTKAKLRTGPTSREVEMQAINATHHQQSFGWSLVDVFVQARQRMRSPHRGR